MINKQYLLGTKSRMLEIITILTNWQKSEKLSRAQQAHLCSVKSRLKRYIQEIDSINSSEDNDPHKNMRANHLHLKYASFLRRSVQWRKTSIKKANPLSKSVYSSKLQELFQVYYVLELNPDSNLLEIAATFKSLES